MKICVPSESDGGLEAAVAGHLGRAPFLTLVDTESGELVVLANAPHAGGGCRPADPLIGRGVDAVVCAGAGRGAVAALHAAGIRVLLTGAERVEDAVAAVRSGDLRVLRAEEACRGNHGQGQGAGARCHRHA